MKEYWSDKAKSLVPYKAGEQPQVQNCIKLNTNENAFPPSPSVLSAIAAAAGLLRKYPAINADVLANAAAHVNGLAPGNIFCANGSDEALALCFLAFFNPGKPVFVPDVTYSFYTVWADLFGIDLQIVPVKSDFQIDVEELMHAPGGVLLANPNAPTSISLPAKEVERIVQNNDSVVIVDEAYVAFGGESVISLVNKYKNLVVVRTLSKSHSLAGLRVGYIAADENLIGALMAIRDSFNSYPVDRLAQEGGAAALMDTAYYEKATQEIIRIREYTAGALRNMDVAVLPSSANFLFIRPPMDAEEVFLALKQKGIFVRWFNKEKIRGYLRVSIGTMEEMECFLGEMKQLLKK